MEVLKVEFKDLVFSMATPSDAENLATLYRKVYGLDYPCPELFTIEGMREFLDFNRSKAATMIITYQEEVVGTATCQLNGRAVYTRGFMVNPVWQGKISAKRAFQHVLLRFRQVFEGRADLFYGEARTETSKIQDIIEGIDWKPMGILPRKDIFHGKRESEIIYAWYYQPPCHGPLNLTSLGARVAEKVLHQTVNFNERQLDLQFNLPLDFSVVEQSESNGDSHIFIRLPSGAELIALLCYKSANSEKLRVNARDIQEFHNLISKYLLEIRSRNIEYTEIYIDAREYYQQVLLERSGFTPTGFLPQWYALWDTEPHDYVVYSKHWCSPLPDCPIQCTSQGEFLKALVEIPATTEAVTRSLPIQKIPEVIGSLG